MSQKKNGNGRKQQPFTQEEQGNFAFAPRQTDGPRYQQAAPQVRTDMRVAAQQQFPDDQYTYDYRYDQPQRQGGGKPPRKRGRRSVIPLIVIMVCIAFLCFAGWFIQGAYTQYTQYMQVRNMVARNVFYDGTTIDGVALGGKTITQAREELTARSTQQSEAFAIVVAYGDKKWRIDSSQVPVGTDYDSVLRQAYAQARSGGLRERYARVLQIGRDGLHLTSEWGYDRAKVRELTDQVVARIAQPAVNARLAAFDPNAKTFLYEQEQAGLHVDGDALYAQVTSALDAQQYNAVIQVQATTVQPEVTQAEIEASFGRISSFSTATTKDKNRNTNINLSAQAVTGRMLEPDAVLSFNECTGQRTQEKGYREAGAISGGQLVDETGGGVCQTSSTLFNAVVRADLEIVSRTQHSWPSTYVPRGEDAAVNWPTLDFKFRNNTDLPIFVVAWYSDEAITVEIYGKTLPAGRTIDLVSETIQTKQPSDEVIYTRSLELAPGVSKVAKQKRTGYIVDTYKVYYQDGVEVGRAKLWRTEYKPVQKEIYFN